MEEKKKDKKLILVVIISIVYTLLTVFPTIFFIGALVFLDSSYPSYEEKADGSVEINNNDMTIKKDIKNYYDEETNAYYIEGYLVNNTDNKIDYITIEYNLYDISNNLLGSADASISNLDKNGTWKFKAIYFDKNDAKQVVKIKLSNVSY